MGNGILLRNEVNVGSTIVENEFAASKIGKGEPCIGGELDDLVDVRQMRLVLKRIAQCPSGDWSCSPSTDLW